MAFGKRAYGRIAEVLEVSETSARHGFELAQAHGWVRRSSGGGKGAAHLYPFELIAIAFSQAIEPRNALGTVLPALLATAPVAMNKWFVRFPGADWPGRDHQHVAQWRGRCFGAAMVALDDYRDLVEPGLPAELDQSNHYSGLGDPRCYRLLPGATFGIALEGFLDFLAVEASKITVSDLRKASFFVQVRSNNTAQVALQENGLAFLTEYRPFDFQLVHKNLSRTTNIFFDVFLVLAELWADSRAHLGITSFPSSSGPVSSASDTPDAKRAAPARAAPRRPRSRLATGSGQTRQDPTSQGDAGTRRVRGFPQHGGNAAGDHLHDPPHPSPA